MTKIAEYDVVRLVRAVPELGLLAGPQGTVVLTYPGSEPEVVEVEFVDADGHTTQLATVATALLEVVWSASTDS